MLTNDQMAQIWSALEQERLEQLKSALETPIPSIEQQARDAGETIGALDT